MSKYLPPLKRLHFLEKELSSLLKANRKSWVKVGKLLLTIEQEGLFNLKFSSYTQYVQNLAWEHSVNVSTFWRAKSSLATYMEIIDANNHESIIPNSVKATPEQLELYKRVQSIIPERILRDVKNRMLKGENVRNELRHLWSIYKPLKKGKTERGRKVKELAVQHTEAILETKQALLTIKEEDSLKDLIKMETFKVSSSEVQRANIVNALRAKNWIKETLNSIDVSNYQFFTDVKVSESNKNLFDAFISVQNDIVEEGNHICFIGALIINDINQFNKLKDWEPSQYCNFCYLAITSPVYKQAKSEGLISQSIGIIIIDEYNEANKLEGKIVNKPQMNHPSVHQKLKIYEILLTKLLKWN